MTIVTQKLSNGLTRTVSDAGFFITDGVNNYAEAIDAEARTYTETDKPIEPDDYPTDELRRINALRIIFGTESTEGIVKQAKEIRKLVEAKAATLTDAEALEAANLTESWTSAGVYASDDRVNDAGEIYKCAAAHLSTPETRPNIDSEHWNKL